VQSPPHRLEALGEVFERLCFATVERVRVIELAQLTDQIARLALACLCLLLLDSRLGQIAHRHLNTLLECRRAPGPTVSLMPICRFGRPLGLALCFRARHLCLGLLDLAGQMQAGRLRHLVLAMKQVRGMVRLAIFLDVAA